MNVATVVAIILGTLMGIFLLIGLGVALFFLIRLIRQLTVALKLAADALDVLVKEAKAVETSKAIRAIAANSPAFIQQMKNLHAIITNFVAFSMQAPQAAQILNPEEVAAGGSGGGKAYTFDESAAADREDEARLMKLGLNNRDSTAPRVEDVGAVGDE